MRNSGLVRREVPRRWVGHQAGRENTIRLEPIKLFLLLAFMVEATKVERVGTAFHRRDGLMKSQFPKKLTIGQKSNDSPWANKNPSASPKGNEHFSKGCLPPLYLT
jgi:hypothetical protein